MKKIKTIMSKITSTFFRKDGFTLIELLIVIAILAILGAFAVTKFTGILDDTKVSTAKSKMKNFELPLSRYNMKYGTYPTTDEGLAKLVEEGYIKTSKDALLDPWKNPYQYRYPGEYSSDPEIWSFGADGKDGGEGKDADIKSWE